MEKRRPTYDLAQIQAVLCTPEALVMTTTAAIDARAIGFDAAQVVQVIQGMERHQFYKSMTTYANHKIWQDVYHVDVGHIVLYVKFQADQVAEFRVMSFKEK
ncbi:type II toxin-antitoxin system MqsR family toxin [Oleisolibacter albus]|uniref:type II toxin-antitoxin system MqsR family toxin n=1 Tax=Oleisolibacter albus TaxID=2171757 RepID=UPI000DF2F591|nr:type II toxin-antitoxin system MqsR family toxin [Oleisolibacter albus]